ncbi:MAG: hypothetical protein KAU94_08075 [Verrucomicrobia bacterium]|nr:hypothetical protein [Verrucomicrobiota bacterium]
MKFANRKHAGTAACTMSLMAFALCGCTHTGWEKKLQAELPVLGHRNWIVIADSAYPKQSAAGIETIYTDADQLEVLDTVLKVIDAATHVQGIVFLDAELDHVTEQDAPGVGAYRKQLKARLNGKQVEAMPHEEIIGKLDADSKLFNILLLKTDMVIPYTSVFLKLDCGYWNAEKENRLREAIGQKKDS